MKRGLLVAAVAIAVAWSIVSLRYQCSFGVAWLGMAPGFFWLAVAKGGVVGAGFLALAIWVAQRVRGRR
jgi:hypothetical protein